MSKPQALSGLPLTLTTTAICLCVFMQVLDYSIANVCIPYISGDLGVSRKIGTWVITCFAVGNAIALPLTGWITQRFGNVKTIIASVTLFTILSWLCGISMSFGMLVLCRFFQGFVAGPLIPLSQSLLLLIYPEKKHKLALSLWNVVALVGPIVGPVLGGWIVLDYTWPWIFLINLPIGICSLVILYIYLRPYESETVRSKVDFIGLIFLAIAVTCLQVLLDNGEQYDWLSSNFIRILAICSAIAFIYLFVYELNIDNPIVNFKLFKDRNFALGTIITAISYMFLFGAIVISPLWLQTTMGYDAYWAGLAVAPMGIIPVLATLPAAKLLEKYSARSLAASSFFFFAIGTFVYMLLTTQVSFEVVAASRLIFGIGICTWLPPLVTLTVVGIKKAELPSAMGIFHFFRILFGGIGTSVFVTVWNRRATHHHHNLIESLTPYTSHAQQYETIMHQAKVGSGQSKVILNAMVDKQAYMLSTNEIFFVSTLLFIGLLFLSFLFKKRPGF